MKYRDGIIHPAVALPQARFCGGNLVGETSIGATEKPQGPLSILSELERNEIYEVKKKWPLRCVSFFTPRALRNSSPLCKDP